MRGLEMKILNRMNSFAFSPTMVPRVWGLFRNARSRVRVNGTFNDDFLVQVGLHQGSVLSLLLFIIVLQVLSRKIRSECPEELLYADDLVLVKHLRTRKGDWKLEKEHWI